VAAWWDTDLVSREEHRLKLQIPENSYLNWLNSCTFILSANVWSAPLAQLTSDAIASEIEIWHHDRAYKDIFSGNCKENQSALLRAIWIYHICHLFCETIFYVTLYDVKFSWFRGQFIKLQTKFNFSRAVRILFASRVKNREYARALKCITQLWIKLCILFHRRSFSR